MMSCFGGIIMALDKMYGVFGHDVLCGKAAFRAAVLRLIKESEAYDRRSRYGKK